MRLYFDENFSPYLIHGLREFQNGRCREGFEILSIKEEFGTGAADEIWIPKVAQVHGVAVTRDLNIQRIQAQRNLWCHHKLGLIIFRPPKKKLWNYWEMIQVTVKVWEELKDHSVSYWKILAPNSKKLNYEFFQKQVVLLLSLFTLRIWINHYLEINCKLANPR